MIDFTRNNQDRIIYIAISMFVILLSVLCFKRPGLNYGVETDFIGMWVPEAIRFLNGNPLKLSFHPPLYSIILSLIYLIFKNWKLSGWILSLISSSIVMIMSYHFIKLIFGNKEAVGAILACFLSWAFISLSIQASSDMFFFALFYCSLFAVAIAEKKEKAYFWIIGGIFAGLTFLTRSNGITVIFLLLFAVASRSRNLSKKKIFVLMVSGIMFPIILWTLYAEISNSPLYVQSNYVNLAVGYFSKVGENGSLESQKGVEKRFSNIWQVLTKDPKHMLFKYAEDLLKNIIKLFTNEFIIAFPFIVFALPGLIFLFLKKFDRFKLILLINLLVMILFLGLHGWMDRLYLFMIPIMGAGIITLIDYMCLHFNLKLNTKCLSIILPIIIVVFLINITFIYPHFAKMEATDSLAASKILINKINSKEAIVIARKQQLSLYTSSGFYVFPEVNTFEELRVSIKNMIIPHNANKAVYLFYGSAELLLRPQFSMLENSDFYAPWLKKVAWGKEQGGWVLYKILTDNL